MKHNTQLTPIILENYFYDLEKLNEDIINTDSLSTEKSYSGKNSYKFTSNIEFGLMHEKNNLEKIIAKKTMRVEFTAKLLTVENNFSDVLIVATASDSINRVVYWDGKKININTNDSAQWKSINYFFNVGEDLFKSGNRVNFYFWNMGKKEFYVDDIEIKYWGKLRK
jgi:hypothetical protein